MEIKQKLIEARTLITDPEHWTQGCHAIENTGAECAVQNEDAYAFCADGALLKVSGSAGSANGEDGIETDLYVHLSNALRAAAKRVFPDRAGVVDINDGDDGHRNVLRIFDDAITHA